MRFTCFPSPFNIQAPLINCAVQDLRWRSVVELYPEIVTVTQFYLLACMHERGLFSLNDRLVVKITNTDRFVVPALIYIWYKYTLVSFTTSTKPKKLCGLKWGLARPSDERRAVGHRERGARDRESYV